MLTLPPRPPIPPSVGRPVPPRNGYISVADPGCLSRIPDPTFFHPGSRIRTVSIPDPGSSSKNLSILTPKKQKNGFLALKNMIRVVHPGSRIRMLTFSHSGSRGQKGTQSRIPDPDPQHWEICISLMIAAKLEIEQRSNTTVQDHYRVPSICYHPDPLVFLYCNRSHKLSRI